MPIRESKRRNNDAYNAKCDYISLRPQKAVGYAIRAAATPRLDQFFREYAHTTLRASGLDVGLPDGQMGNSEVGHTNIGAGRVVYQELTRITKSIEEGEYLTNPALAHAMENAKKPGRQSVLPAFGL